MGFAMRLYHMGLAVAVEGDMTTPPVGKGDLFIVTCGPGEISTALALMGVARAAGSKILFITAQPQSRGAALADFVLHLPAQTMADDRATSAPRFCPWARCLRSPVRALRSHGAEAHCIAQIKLKRCANHTNLNSQRPDLPGNRSRGAASSLKNRQRQAPERFRSI